MACPAFAPFAGVVRARGVPFFLCVCVSKEVFVAMQRLADVLKEEQVQQLINWALRYIADLELPVKRGTFVDFRTGLVNFSPAGRHLTKV